MGIKKKSSFNLYGSTLLLKQDKYSRGKRQGGGGGSWKVQAQCLVVLG